MDYKGYTTKLAGGFGMVSIHSAGSGALPNKLAGTWTSNNAAVKAIDNYLKAKEVKNAKATSTGRGK